jgi:SpoVK/Ycf46/Vps4 family AAA+-type ATPase
MVLTSSDIGASPERIESILSDGFKTASSWGAVLLIDEADVFMERRSTNDLNRNVLVAGFLRALEFYDGILFLTTNRVGAFDDAFISRIHVKLYYPEFTDSERQRVWQTFIDKLARDRGQRIRVSIDAKEFIRGKAMREVRWNGREIRNAFQTAVALAEYEDVRDEEGRVVLTDGHLRSIVDMSRSFQRYLDETHGADEEKRAAMEGGRFDDRGVRVREEKGDGRDW